MTTPQPIEIPVNLTISNLDQLVKRLEGLRLPNNPMSPGGGGGGGGAGREDASGERARSKEGEERDKVRNTALQNLARSFPGGGLMTGMAKSFGSGGIMAGMATGMTAAVGILTSIMKSSQVFQTLGGTVFKILGMMADLFLMPFVPLMMRFAQWMISHMPEIQEAGQVVADGITKMVNFFTGETARANRAVREDRQEQISIGMSNLSLGKSFEGEDVGFWKGLLNRAIGGANISRGGHGFYQFGSAGGGGGGPRIVMGNSMAGGGEDFSGKVGAWIQRFQQKELGPGGVMDKWYDEMFGNSILPDIWNNIGGFFGSIESETGTVSSKVSSELATSAAERTSFWDKLKFWEHFPAIGSKIMEFFTGMSEKLVEFVTFDIPGVNLGGAIGLIGACFARAGGAVSTFFTETIPNVARSAASGISAAARWTWGSGVKAEEWTTEKLESAKNTVWRFFSETLPDFGSMVLGYVIEKAKDIKDAVVGVATTVGGAVWDKVYPVYDAVRNFFMDTIPEYALKAYNGVLGFIGNAGSFAANITENTVGALGSAKDATAYFFTDTLPWMITQVGYEIQDKIWDIRMWGSEIYQGVLDEIVNMKNKIAGWYKQVEENIEAAIKAVQQKMGLAGLTIFGQSVLKTFGGSREKDTSDDNQYTHGSHASANRPNSVTVRSQRENINPHEQTSVSYRPFNTNPHEQTRMFHFGGSNGGGPRVVMGNPGSMQQGGGAVSNRQVNVTINSSLSVNDIVRDVERLESMNEAAFFNTI